MTKVICSHARQCKQVSDNCYHKSPHEINFVFCSNHICKFNKTVTLYETTSFELVSTNKDKFTCIEVIYK